MAENFPDFRLLLLRKPHVSSDRPDSPEEIEKPLRNQDAMLPRAFTAALSREAVKAFLISSPDPFSKIAL